MLSITVFIPPDHPVAQQNIIEVFSWLEQIWSDSLRAGGVPCRGVDQAMSDNSKTISQQQDLKWDGYASLSHGEIVSDDGRKLVGLAQIRKRKGVALVSGLHLCPSDWSLLSSVVVDNPQQGDALERLNSDAQSLSGTAAETLLPDLINAFSERMPEGFILTKP